MDEHNLRDSLQVIFDSVLDNIIDVDDELFEFLESLVHVGQIALDVHGCPSQCDHTRSEFKVKIFDVRKQEVLADRLDLRVDSLVFLECVEEFVVVGFKLVFLEENDLRGFRDFNTLSIEALSFSDELHDFQVEVHVELLVFIVSDDESGLECSLGLFDFIYPILVVPHFVDGELLAESVVGSVVSTDFSRIDHVLRENVDWAGDLLEEMARPDDFTSFRRHVTDQRRVRFLVLEDTLNGIEISGIVVEDSVVSGSQIVLQGVTLDRRLELVKEFQ